ncbi:MAG TPA: glutathione S-transferase N-terminal domain-containing protein [Hyphomicrobiaceae bacterium]|nr:glutathione S-transferase N-terminal domain-containing protein [Hyphomicrobiaceae bacterium]
MRLYVTLTSPYARLARIVVREKGLEAEVVEIVAETRKPGSPYYRINPSGRVPYLVRDDGIGMEDSQLICLYLDHLGGAPALHLPFETGNWAYGRIEATARSLCDGISVWVREMRRPAGERSPNILAHEIERARRLADVFEHAVRGPPLAERVTMASLLLLVAVDSSRFSEMDDLEATRPTLAAWAKELRRLPSVAATAPKK